MQLGDRIEHNCYGIGVVVGFRFVNLVPHAKVMFDEDEVDRIIPVESKNITKVNDTPAAKKVTSKRGPKQPAADLTPSTINNGLLAHLLATGVSIRVTAIEKAEKQLHRLLNGVGCDVPEGFQFVDVGAKGGTTEMYGVCFRTTFAVPADPTVISDRYKVVRGQAEVCTTSFALGLLQAGFPLTSWKGQN